MQRALSSYLIADFAHCIGAYDGALELLAEARVSGAGTTADALRTVIAQAARFNADMRDKRFSTDVVSAQRPIPGPVRSRPGEPVLRFPEPPEPATIDEHVDRNESWAQTQADCIAYCDRRRRPVASAPDVHG